MKRVGKADVMTGFAQSCFTAISKTQHGSSSIRILHAAHTILGPHVRSLIGHNTHARELSQLALLKHIGQGHPLPAAKQSMHASLCGLLKAEQHISLHKCEIKIRRMRSTSCTCTIYSGLALRLRDCPTALACVLRHALCSASTPSPSKQLNSAALMRRSRGA